MIFELARQKYSSSRRGQSFVRIESRLTRESTERLPYQDTSRCRASVHPIDPRIYLPQCLDEASDVDMGHTIL